MWNPITDENAPDWDKMQWYRYVLCILKQCFYVYFNK